MIRSAYAISVDGKDYTAMAAIAMPCFLMFCSDKFPGIYSHNLPKQLEVETNMCTMCIMLYIHFFVRQFTMYTVKAFMIMNFGWWI